MRQELDSIRALVDRYDARSKQLLLMERMQLVANLVNRRSGTNIVQVGLLKNLEQDVQARKVSWCDRYSEDLNFIWLQPPRAIQ